MKLILQITLFFIYFDALLAQDYLKYYLEAGFKNNLKLNAERKNYKSIKENINISRSEFLPSISLSGDQSSTQSTNKTNQSGTNLKDSSLDTETKKISVDQKTNLEIQQLYLNIISLQMGKYLPNIELTDINNDIRIANNFQFDRPIIYTFWSYEQNSHQISLFNRIFEFLNTNTKYQFHCININSNKMKWKESLEKIRRSKHITHFISNDFNKMSKKMVLNNLNKIIITDRDGKVTSISSINKLNNYD